MGRGLVDGCKMTFLARRNWKRTVKIRSLHMMVPFMSISGGGCTEIHAHNYVPFISNWNLASRVLSTVLSSLRVLTAVKIFSPAFGGSSRLFDAELRGTPSMLDGGSGILVF